jgi:hypothetical protein
VFANLLVLLSKYFTPACESLLESKPNKKNLLITGLWIAGLYFTGIIIFGHFFNWGNFDLLYHDWAQITGPRLQALLSAIQGGQMPLHISDAETFHLITVRYLAVADSFFSPQYLLLAFLSLPVFSLVNVWLLYTIGFAGLLVLYRKLHLSAISFTVLFLLFNFNGMILAHYSVGHTNWGGYFLFPWFAWLVFRLLGGDHSWAWTTQTALLLFFIWLQGSYHQFVWLLVLLAGIALFNPRKSWIVLRTGMMTLLVCGFRLLPCILEYQKYQMSFLNGFPSLFSLWDNLVNLPDPVYTSFFLRDDMLGNSVGEWELTYFIGLLGALFLVYFGIYRGLLHSQSPFKRLLGPLGCILLLSLGQVIQITSITSIPLLGGERVSSRMFSVVLTFGLILGAERFQRWLDIFPNKLQALIGSLLGLGIISFDLMQDFSIWRISQRDMDFWIYFNPDKWYILNNYSDLTYIRLIWIGAALTVVSTLFLFFLSARENRRKRKL